MATATSSSVTMSNPDRWIAFLRIVVGLYFVKSLVTKMSIVLLGGVVPVPAVSERWINVMPNIVAKQASGNPLGFYKQFLEGTVLTHPELFATLTAWGVGRERGTEAQVDAGPEPDVVGCGAGEAGDSHLIG